MWKSIGSFLEKNELQFTNKLKKQSKKIEKLESGKIMLQNQILEIKKRNLRNQQEIEELEQFRRRLCIVPTP